MKGARQLVWSRGLKKLVGIGEKSDEEIANETDEESITLREVDQITFDLLIKYKKRHEFLEWQKRDFLNGCYGSGETEQNL
ncbi:rolling circle replication protein, Rep63 protein, partial [Acinetobacter baumannii]